MTSQVKNRAIKTWLLWIALYGTVLILGAFITSNYWIYIVGIVAVIVVFVVAYYSPKIGWALYVFSVMANGLVIDAQFGTIRPELIALPLLFIVWSRLKRSRGIGEAILNPTMVLFSAAVWLSTLVLSSMFVAPETYKSLWIALQIIVAFLTYLIVSDCSEKITLIRVGSYVIGVIAAFSVLGYAISNWIGVGNAYSFGVAVDGRLIGLSFEINVFAAQCVGWLALLFVSKDVRGRWVLPVSSVLVMSILLSGTRAAWIALAVLAVLCLRRWFGEAQFVRLALVAIPLSGVGFYVASSYSSVATNDFAWRMSNILNLSEGTGAYRLNIYNMALTDIDSISRLLFGSGANSFSQYHAIDATGVSAPYLSSVWPAVIYDAGIVGLMAFVLVFLFCIFRFRVGLYAAIVPGILLLCATTTNTTWFAFPWVIIALVEVRAQDKTEVGAGRLAGDMHTHSEVSKSSRREVHF